MYSFCELKLLQELNLVVSFGEVARKAYLYVQANQTVYLATREQRWRQIYLWRRPSQHLSRDLVRRAEIP